MRKEYLEFLRQQHPNGSRIRLREMKDPYHPVKPGTMGTLEVIDDMGTFHVRWDNGRSLGLVPGEDQFTVLPPEPTLLKLYMPLTGDRYERNGYRDWEEEPYPVSDQELMEQEDAIVSALFRFRVPEEAHRGIMYWYPASDSVNEKVQSITFQAECRENKLWGVAECLVVGELTPRELETLKDYVSGQASDGWGEGFEQMEIPMGDGILNVHLWNEEQWQILTEEEQFGLSVQPEMEGIS